MGFSTKSENKINKLYKAHLIYRRKKLEIKIQKISTNQKKILDYSLTSEHVSKLEKN